MTIIGGGIVTPVMGFVSDAAGKIPTAELVPALCFAVIFIFAPFPFTSGDKLNIYPNNVRNLS